ncbi:hypothetical protein [Rhizobium sp. 22-785-1]
MKYYDVFGVGGFHSAFMTTYAFGTLAFEDIPFPRLRGSGCRNIVVFADRTMVNNAFAEFGPPTFAGTSYHLIKAKAPRAFHPKITMLIGEKKGRLLIGSANLTALGLGGNKEQVASISYSEETPETAALFASVIGYLRRYVPEDDQWFRVSLERAIAGANWLQGYGSEPAFNASQAGELNVLFDRPDLSVLEQIRLSVGGDPISELVVVSPYWDTQLEGLARLQGALGSPITHLLIDRGNGFPTAALSKLPGVSLFDISENAANRFLHAKLIIARGKAFDHVISGSVNCTYPALMGPAAGGNAEAAIYKRNTAGTALGLLGLSDYRQKALKMEEVAKLELPLAEQDAVEVAADGGTLTLQSGVLKWKAPQKLHGGVERIELFDKDGNYLPSLDPEDQSIAVAAVLSEQKPRYGKTVFSGGSVSAPIAVVDLDTLAQSTLPPKRGKKKRLFDKLLEADFEGLDIYECLSDLEEIEDAELAGQQTDRARATHEKADSEAKTYQPLTYDEFIKARTRSELMGSRYGLYLHSSRDRAVNMLSICLNRMIDLVGVDLAALEDQAIENENNIDLRSREPISTEEPGNMEEVLPKSPESKAEAAANLATAKKFQDAVNAFSRRCKAQAGQSITTSEMVRVRALLQIILAHAQPISGKATSSQILPIYKADGHDWPRLIGRLLLLHFGSATRALQHLTVQPDEAEQHRVIEYLALANWAGQAALQAVKFEKKAVTLVQPLLRVTADLAVQTTAIFAVLSQDQLYYDQIQAKLTERFAARLALGNSR